MGGGAAGRDSDWCNAQILHGCEANAMARRAFRRISAPAQTASGFAMRNLAIAGAKLTWRMTGICVVAFSNGKADSIPTGAYHRAGLGPDPLARAGLP
jgi:hypothetical protein